QTAITSSTRDFRQGDGSGRPAVQGGVDRINLLLLMLEFCVQCPNVSSIPGNRANGIVHRRDEVIDAPARLLRVVVLGLDVRKVINGHGRVAFGMSATWVKRTKAANPSVPVAVNERWVQTPVMTVKSVWVVRTRASRFTASEVIMFS